jgi:uncharacterized protein YjiS (DUF1127 family)
MSHSAAGATDDVTWRADRKAGALDSVFRWLARLLVEQRYRKAIDELERLDDRLLTDIGITRSGIAYAIRYGVNEIASEPRPARYSATWLAAGAVTLVSLFSIGLLIAAPAEPCLARPIRFIVPFAAGGPNGISARIIGDALGTALRQPIVIENRPGANFEVSTPEAMSASIRDEIARWRSLVERSAIEPQ